MPSVTHREVGMKKIPDNCDFIQLDRGPCEVSTDTKFIEIETNQLGKVQLHPCGRILCTNIMLYNEEYGWLFTDDEIFWKRALIVVKEALDKQVSGWNKLHLLGVQGLAREEQRRIH
jgi:hypothetical protein